MKGPQLMAAVWRVFKQLPTPESCRISGNRGEALLITQAENLLIELDDIYPNDTPHEPPHQKLWEYWARLKSQWEAVHSKP
jgi:hypothetical protein